MTIELTNEQVSLVLYLFQYIYDGAVAKGDRCLRNGELEGVAECEKLAEKVQHIIDDIQAQVLLE